MGKYENKKSWKLSLKPTIRLGVVDMRNKEVKKTFEKILFLALIGLFFLMTLPQPLEAKSRKEKLNLIERSSSKATKGAVSFIAENTVSIEYYKKRGVAKEIIIPFGKNTLMRHFQGMDDLAVGDIVVVKYKETYMEDEEGKRADFNRIAMLITLIRKSDSSLRPPLR